MAWWDQCITVRVVMEPLPATSRAWAAVGGVAGALLSFGAFPSDMVSLMCHSAIIVDGEIYEFTVDGLVQHRKGSPSALELEEREWPQWWTSLSRKSLSAFRRWAVDQNKFTKHTYRIADNNCHDFVTDACQFLEVPVPSKVREIVSKCRSPHYRTWIRLGGASTSAR